MYHHIISNGKLTPVVEENIPDKPAETKQRFLVIQGGEDSSSDIREKRFEVRRVTASNLFKFDHCLCVPKTTRWYDLGCRRLIAPRLIKTIASFTGWKKEHTTAGIYKSTLDGGAYDTVVSLSIEVGEDLYVDWVPQHLLC